MRQTIESITKRAVLEAFDTLFNKRDLTRLRSGIGHPATFSTVLISHLVAMACSI